MYGQTQMADWFYWQAPFCIFTFEIFLVCKDFTHYLLQFIKKFLKVQTFEKIKRS